MASWISIRYAMLGTIWKGKTNFLEEENEAFFQKELTRRVKKKSRYTSFSGEKCLYKKWYNHKDSIPLLK